MHLNGGYDPDRLDARDLELVRRTGRLASRVARAYMRMEAEGQEHLAAPGRVLYVGNHNGGIFGPDLACTVALLWEALGEHTPIYGLAHDFAMRHLPPFGRTLQRLGAIRASRVNAVRVLESGARLLVYPGGDLDAFRHARRRDEVVFGPRTGFAAVARDTRAAIVPIVAHGAHSSAYIFHEGEGLARALRMPRWARLERFPVALALPWGVAVGPWVPYLPLPRRVRMRVLAPIPHDAAGSADALARLVQLEMQRALDDLAARARR